MAGAVAKRYADALFELADEKGVRHEVAGGLAQFRQALAGDSALAKRFFDARTEIADKKKLIAESLVPGGHALVANVLGILVDRRREGVALDVALGFFERLEEAEGLLRVEIESALPIEPDTQARLTSGLSAATKRQVVATTVVVPELLGGVRLIIGSRRLDGSVKRKIENLADRLRASV